MRIIFTIILLLIISLSFAQRPSERMLDQAVAVEAGRADGHHVHDFSHYMEGCSNEAESIFTAFFIAYKNFVSSQDSRSCTFEPSCSVYSIETIKKNGVIVGLLDTIDRLTRCNGLSPRNYPIQPDTHLLIDYP